MYVYWGGRNTGKSHLKRLCIGSKKTYTDYYRSPYVIKKTIVTDKLQRYFYYKIDDSLKIHEKVDELSISFKYAEKVNFAGDSIRTKPKDPSLYESIENGWIERLKHKVSPLKDDMESIWNLVQDSYIHIQPLSLLNLYPHKGSFESKPTIMNTHFVDILKQYTHIIPYKSDMVDGHMSKLNMFYSNPEYYYYNKREDLWVYLDTFYNNINHMKFILESHDIPYHMFDLDSDSYAIMGLDECIPKNYTHPVYTDPDKEKVLKDISKSYELVRLQRAQSYST